MVNALGCSQRTTQTLLKAGTALHKKPPREHSENFQNMFSWVESV
jgi:hypothetical protein